jgi:hypothetical protein
MVSEIFQEAVGILVAEEIHNDGCNRADQKEHQAFSGEIVSSSLYQHRTAAEKKKSGCG